MHSSKQKKNINANNRMKFFLSRLGIRLTLSLTLSGNWEARQWQNDHMYPGPPCKIHFKFISILLIRILERLHISHQKPYTMPEKKKISPRVYTKHGPNYLEIQCHWYHGMMMALLWSPSLNHREDHTPWMNLPTAMNTICLIA